MLSLMFSVVIPSKNEEFHIKRLLLSIKSQTLQPNEIIVADKSADRTAEVARKFGANVVEGVDDGRIGRGRNLGAQHVNTDIIVFLDADTELDKPNTFSKMIGTFIEKDLDIATCYISPDEKDLPSNLAFSAINAEKFLNSLTKKVVHESGACVTVKTTVYKELDGFLENMVSGEDAEFLKRAVAEGKRFGVIPLRIKSSSRRYKGKGLKNLLLITIGSIGLSLGAFYGVKWFKDRQKKFEKSYGPMGGKDPADN